MTEPLTDHADGMVIEYQVPIEVDDGLVLRADIFRPEQPGRYASVLSYGPYAKGLAFQEAYAAQWDKMVADHPDVAGHSTNRYQSWEVVDPEKWVPHGYVCVRVDSRGAGWSPGYMDVWSPREQRDIHDAIEWAAAQPWSNGKVGMAGISYYAINQWQVAALHPPHLAAMIPWEGAGDLYRDMNYHGGIHCEFAENWYPHQVETVQHGLGERARRNPNTGESVAGPETFTPQQLQANRTDFGAEIRAHPLDDSWHRARSAVWSEVTVPFLSAANWGGQGLHLRGNVEAFTQAAAQQKWLEIHGDSHWSLFYTDHGVDLQRRFFDHFLRGVDNGWDREPRVQLQVRHVDHFVRRTENEWPLARTRWTPYHLDAATGALRGEPLESASTVEYDALGDGVDFSMTVDAETEITGPMAAKLFVSSTTADADLFLVVRVFRPDGDEVVFQGALDPNTPVAQGWLRLSHRRLDAAKSLPYRPYHTHDEVQAATPGEIYEVDVEILPSCIVIPAGYRVTLSVRGRDYEYGGELDEFARTFHYAGKGCGPFVHTSATDRPADVFGGRVTIHCGGPYDSHLLLPVIPLRLRAAPDGAGLRPAREGGTGAQRSPR